MDRITSIYFLTQQAKLYDIYCLERRFMAESDPEYRDKLNKEIDDLCTEWCISRKCLQFTLEKTAITEEAFKRLQKARDREELFNNLTKHI